MSINELTDQWLRTKSSDWLYRYCEKDNTKFTELLKRLYANPLNTSIDKRQPAPDISGDLSSRVNNFSDTSDIAKQPHYATLSPQPIEIIEKWGLNFHFANAIKYIARAGNKPGNSAQHDITKAVWYLRRWLGQEPLPAS